MRPQLASISDRLAGASWYPTAAGFPMMAVVLFPGSSPVALTRAAYPMAPSLAQPGQVADQLEPSRSFSRSRHFPSGAPQHTQESELGKSGLAWWSPLFQRNTLSVLLSVESAAPVPEFPGNSGYFPWKCQQDVNSRRMPRTFSRSTHSIPETLRLATSTAL
jgi:hypothetical protein